MAKKEAETLRGQLAERGGPAVFPEQLQSLSRVKAIQINKLLTGGLDRDGKPGDDQLNVVLVPQDERGEPVKLPGTVELEVLDLAASPKARQIGVWRFTSQEVAAQWQSGLSSGFQFQIPWQGRSDSQNLVLHARLATADGRQFDTSTDVRITPGPAVGQTQIAEQSNPSANQVPLAPEPDLFAAEPGGAIESSHPAKALRMIGGDGLNEKPTIRQQSGTDGLTEDDFFPMAAPEPVGTTSVQTPALPSDASEEFFPADAPVPVGAAEIQPIEPAGTPELATKTASAPETDVPLEVELPPTPEADEEPAKAASAPQLEKLIPMRYQRTAKAPLWEPPADASKNAP